MARSVLLVGGGHAHLRVLSAFAEEPLDDADVVLVNAGAASVYSGMVPGVVAGRYRPRQARIDLERLASRSGARFVLGRARAVDARGHRVELEDGRSFHYDLLSLDVGSEPRHPETLDPDAKLIRVKPIDRALAELEQALAALSGPCRIAVIGAGAGGVELAFGLASRPGTQVAVYDGASTPLSQLGGSASRRVLEAFAEHGVRFSGGRRAVHVKRGSVVLDDGSEHPVDLTVWATGAAAPALCLASGLPCDERGFLRVEDSLCSTGDRDVFAAGDCAVLRSHPALPKAGVVAVREGPVLAANLRRALSGAPLVPYRPQARFLSLLNTGDGRAILVYGPIALRSRWAWRLKDAIDRRFVAAFR